MSKSQERMSSLRHNLLRCSLLLFIVIFSLSQQALAEELEGSSREAVLTHIKDAFDAQISLTEKARSHEEIKQMLSTYFEDKLIEKYMKENVHELDDQFIVYGTDFPIYTIPFFTYDESTRVLEQANERIIFEFFPASTDGPVGYEDHYEVVKMRNTNKRWIIYSIDNETKQPEMIGEQTTEENAKVQSQLDPYNVEATSSYLNQSIKELNEVLFFSSFYIQTKNILNEYFLSKFSVKSYLVKT